MSNLSYSRCVCRILVVSIAQPCLTKRHYNSYNLQSDGSESLVTGPYLITDNGYARWRIMQCPIKCCTNAKELRWSCRLESVRKDVECFFGRLKARFRILRSDILFHHQYKVDNVFVASSILHNMNLLYDGFDVAWKDPSNWETPDDEDDSDLREGRERLRMRGKMVQSEVAMAEVESGRRIVVEELDIEEDASYGDFRQQLIEHYIYCSNHNLVDWI